LRPKSPNHIYQFSGSNWETVTPGFEAKLRKLSPPILRPNRRKPSQQVLRSHRRKPYQWF
jgi:hypothetical protein